MKREFCQQASSPYRRRDINLKERIQCPATLMVKGITESPKVNPNIFSLKLRWLRGDLILAYNIFHGCLDLLQVEFFEDLAWRDLRGHGFKVRHRCFTCFGGKVPAIWGFSSRGKSCQSKSSILPCLTPSSDCWTLYVLSCSPPPLDCYAPSVQILHGLRRFIVPLYFTTIFDLK